MEEIFAFLEDMNKRLSRPIKDLDDIRLAMNALKEIREKEIKIDMCLGPIEVRTFVCNISTIINYSYGWCWF
jgi:dynein heavy chain